MLKLWAFNIGHPCPSLAKGSWLVARLACFKYYYYSRHTQHSNNTTLSAARLRDRRPDYLHSIKHRQPRTIPRQAPHLAYERSVGFASLQNSGRSISGILARPLPKGAGLRQGSLVSSTTVLPDTCNAQILQTLSAVKTEGSPHRLSPLHQTSPPPHYPIQRKTGRRFSHRYPVVIIDFCL